MEKTLIRAGAIAHRETGLTIGAHTGQAVAAFEQLAILTAMGVHPSAWIWIHAQNEKDLTRHVEAAKQGAWISFDGVGPETIDAHVGMVVNLRDHGLLDHALVSQDAGWYSVGEPNGGTFRAFDTVYHRVHSRVASQRLYAGRHRHAVRAQPGQGVLDRQTPEFRTDQSPVRAPHSDPPYGACTLNVTTNRLALVFH